MQCPACNLENPPEARFCIGCGQGLGRVCAACGTESTTQARFCMACAAPLDTSAAPESAPSPSTATPHQSSTLSAQQPSSFADGRYQVKRFLGEGGKKKVYQAHDTTLDRDVAFALIKTEGLDDTSRTRIQREAQAMGRLGSHPHIVTVFDLGEEPGRGEFARPLKTGSLRS